MLPQPGEAAGLGAKRAVKLRLERGIEHPLEFGAGFQAEFHEMAAEHEGLRGGLGEREFVGLGAELRDQSGSRLPLLVQAFRREWRGPRVRSIHEPLDPAPTLGRVLLAVQRWRHAPR